MRELRLPILVNRHERAVDAHLARVCDSHDLRLHCKPRLADVLPVTRGEDLSYALKGHFDFVLADSDGLAELAVEFDGPAHRDDPVTIARDTRKARICREFMLPLLRVGAPALRPVGQRTLLSWVLEVWKFQRDLRCGWDQVHATEERGEDWQDDLPEMRPGDFDYRTYGCPDEDEPYRMLVAPLDAFHEARQRVGLTHMETVGGNFDGWSQDTGRHTVGYLALEVRSGTYLLGTGRADLSGLSPWVEGLLPSAVAQDLALLDLDRQIREWQAGRLRALSREGVEATVAGARSGLLRLFETPSRIDRAMFVVKTVEGWGMKVDGLARARLWDSLMGVDNEPDPYDDW